MGCGKSSIPSADQLTCKISKEKCSQSISFLFGFFFEGDGGSRDWEIYDKPGIWLNQAAKGMRDRSGRPVNNPHLILLFHRLCKLLYFRIKPVFVFDGGAPALKRRTLEARRENRQASQQDAEKTREKLVHRVFKKHILLNVLGKEGSKEDIPVEKEKDMFELPESSTASQESFVMEVNSESEEDDFESHYQNLDDIDVESEEFSSLPAEVQHEILTEMRERKKRSRIAVHELPRDGEEFSSFQMSKALQMNRLTKKLDRVKQDMNDRVTGHLGVSKSSVVGRIRADDDSHFILLTGLQKTNQAAEEASQRQTVEKQTAKTEHKEQASTPEDDFVLIASSSSDESDDDSGEVIVLKSSAPAKIAREEYSQPLVDLTAEDSDSISMSECSSEGDVVAEKPPVAAGEDAVAQVEPEQPSTSAATSVEESTRREENGHEPNGNDTSVSEPPRDQVEVVPVEPASTSPKVTTEPSESSEPSSTEELAVPSPDLMESVLVEEAPQEITIESGSSEASDDDFVEVPDESVRHVPRLAPKAVEPLLQAVSAQVADLQQQQMVHQRRAAQPAQSAATEAQELLQLFGVPYVVAPMEAEAQCAFLDAHQLVDGVVTDDSDVWLFGGRRVVRNFFGDETRLFLADDVESQLQLGREQLVQLALLVGSDYTEGVTGVGCNSALEVLREFRGPDALARLKEQLLFPREAVSPIVRRLQRLRLPADFPNDVVCRAYLEPEVDSSLEPFSWSTPDLDLIREFAESKLGWDRARVDQQVLPVLRRLNEPRTAQRRLDEYMSLPSSSVSAPVRGRKRALKE